nr:6389_t:CDS:2 [Entrophospora candida]
MTESDFIISLNFLSIILSTLGMIIGCDITTNAITQGLTTMVFWGITVISIIYNDSKILDYKPTEIEFEKDIIVSTAFINFLNAFLKPILLIIPSTVQGVILYPKYDNIIIVVTVILSVAASLIFLHRKVQMSQAQEPQMHPKPKIFPELNEILGFLKLFFVELKTIFLKFCLFGDLCNF